MSNFKYNKKDIRKWVEALRSGKYKQGKISLQNANGFCCLGVACDIFIPQDKKTLSDDFLAGGFPETQAYAPEWLKKINDDFAVKTLIVNECYQSTSLSNMNDDLSIRDADMIQLVYLEGAFDE